MPRWNWDLLVFRLVYISICGAAAVAFPLFGLTPPASLACGLLLATGGVFLERRIRRASTQSILGATIGLAAGAGLALLFCFVLDKPSPLGQSATQFARLAISFTAVYMGVLIGLAKSHQLRLGSLGKQASDAPLAHPKILDTSVLIDGRIADIAESGFVDGALVVPQFVLHELQFVADSAESVRRTRGRRGLDVVRRLQAMPGTHLEISVADFPQVREVDLKLIELAKSIRAKIVTNDFNLNKVAQLQGVSVLNINELANSLRPVVLPGESMRVFILKEGKEHNQGVAYLDDGTMVVVDNARRQISKTVDVLVTSVLQTTAGKMIFGKFDERQHDRSHQDARAPVASSHSPAGAPSPDPAA